MMFEKLLALFERLVIAQEAIAAGTAASGAALNAKAKPEDAPVEKTTKRGKKAAAAAESGDDPVDDKPKRGRKKQSGPDLGAMRKEVEELAQVFASADDDEALEEFKKLLEDFGERTVKKISDDDLPNFHEELKKLADEFFEFDEE